jgi:uncharacterized protein
MSPTRQTILHHPVIRMIAGLALTLGIGLAAMYGAQQLLGLTTLPDSDKDPISGTIFAALVCAIYILLYRRYENRPVTELSARNLPQNLLAGILIGASLAGAIVFIQFLAHDLNILSTHHFLPLLPNLWNTFVNSIVAEVLIVGILFRLTEDWLGTYPALILLFILFFVLHITAPGATILNATCVALHAALLCPTVYIYTRSLWTSISLHFAWDFSFAALYGASINGNTMGNSLMTTSTTGPNWLTGGYFGPQGSLQAGLLCLLFGIFLLKLSKKHRLIDPSRTRLSK